MGLIFNIKKTLANKGETSAFWNRAYYIGKYSMAKAMTLLLGKEGYAKWFYRTYTGKDLNLDAPKYYNEKMWWLKLHNRDPLMTICSDKYAVRQYVKDCGYEDILIPQLDVLDSAEELDFSKYSCEVIAKCTHNSGGHVFYDPSKPLSAKELKQAKSDLRFILRHDASVLSEEWNYKNITPRIVVEQVIRDQNGELPMDYRFFCFDGEPKLLMMDIGTLDESGHHTNTFSRNIYDMEFHLLQIQWGSVTPDDRIKKPLSFARMIEIARKLSRPFPACRVDLYDIDGKVYFGEITFYHSGASQNVKPEEWDLRMGDWIDLNNPKIVLA